ncbi:MAG: PKD domain-containing protein [Bacteroidetes bacterium]|nr:PKD domain-containing protein [Bacteroidota bacterium]
MRISKAILIPAFLLIISGGCYKNEPVPLAAFTFKGTNGFKIPCKVTFINNSENSFYWLWNLGDDSTSWAKEPVKTYSRPGKYIVTMRAYTESQKEWASTAQTVVIADTVQ